MESLYILIPVALFLVVIIGVVFFWAVKSGQFDDLEGPAYRILMDDDAAPDSTTKPAGEDAKAAAKKDPD